MLTNRSTKRFLGFPGKIRTFVLVFILISTGTLTISGQINEIPLPEFSPTFHSIGVSWKPSNASRGTEALVKFRPQDSEIWFDGYPLWYSQDDDMYRGSLVHLMPGTTYDVQLTLLPQNIRVTTTASTRSEEFPIAHVVELTPESNEVLIIEDSGTEDGYILYVPHEGASAVIDGQNQLDYNIHIDASYIIVRGLTLRNAGRHAIFLDDDAHDVVIENNDISGWGRIKYDDTGFGYNGDAGIYSETEDRVRNITIQRNKIHHPRADTNSWGEPRPDIDEASSGWHPSGPQAVYMINSGGGHIIRYNEIYSDADHQFNDCIGGAQNFSDRGFPNRDSDIYGNYITHCWDNSIEAEGANANVRIWGNYTEKTYIAVATRDSSLGPLYIWRNVVGESRRYPANIADSDNDPRGDFHKAGGEEVGDNGVFVFHNTTLQPEADNLKYPLGVGFGMEGPMENTTSRNNILDVTCIEEPCFAIIPSDGIEDNSFDYDLLSYPASINIAMPNSISGRPVYTSEASFDYDSLTGIFTLDPSSLGYDQGVVIPNFNSQYFTGNAPDMGAHEAGNAPMEFGVRAYLMGEPYSLTYSANIQSN